MTILTLESNSYSVYNEVARNAVIIVSSDLAGQIDHMVTLTENILSLPCTYLEG